jgi:hypothetical protein
MRDRFAKGPGDRALSLFERAPVREGAIIVPRPAPPIDP